MLVFLYSSRAQIVKALGGWSPDARIKYFSAPSPRLSHEDWAPRDVGVLGPSLAGNDAWIPSMLAHEFTHAFTWPWFDDTAHRPTLLMEGLATAVEGGRSYGPLRTELATGNHDLPLDTAFSIGSFWSGNKEERARLGYLEGGAIVLYVLQRWDTATLRRFVRAVADSDLTREALDEVMRDTLGVSWQAFVAGLREFVWTLP